MFLNKKGSILTEAVIHLLFAHKQTVQIPAIPRIMAGATTDTHTHTLYALGELGSLLEDVGNLVLHVHVY